MKTRALALCILLTVLLSGCESAKEKYSTTFYGVFDTYVTLAGFAESEAAFLSIAQETKATLERLHALFDGYTEYEGLINLRSLNERCAIAPVYAPGELIDLLLWCKRDASEYGSRVNIAMGAVLSLWHDSRAAAVQNPESASLPSREALGEAAKHCSMDDLIIDEAEQTVFFADPALKLDLGAVAKGWAADIAADALRKSAMPSFILNLGGNVVAGEKPLDGRDMWNISVMNPDAGAPGEDDMLTLLRVTDQSVSTSGDYQRYFEIGGARYHHIIDPDTLEPSRQIRAATVVGPSSAITDWLSTELMLLSYDQGRERVDSIRGYEALWVLNDGSVAMTDGMAAYARLSGGGE